MSRYYSSAATAAAGGSPSPSDSPPPAFNKRKGKGRPPVTPQDASGHGKDNGDDDEDEEDDFMSDKFLVQAAEETSKQPKSYAQKRKEAQKRHEERGYTKSRAEREKEAREEGLKRNILYASDAAAPSGAGAGARAGAGAGGAGAPSNAGKTTTSDAATPSGGGNKALEMMIKMGFRPGEALGKKQQSLLTTPVGSGNSSADDIDSETSTTRGGIGSSSLGNRKRAASSTSSRPPPKAAKKRSSSKGKGKGKGKEAANEPPGDFISLSGFGESDEEQSSEEDEDGSEEDSSTDDRAHTSAQSGEDQASRPQSTRREEEEDDAPTSRPGFGPSLFAKREPRPYSNGGSTSADGKEEAGEKAGPAPPSGTAGLGAAAAAARPGPRIDPIAIQMRSGRGGLGVEEAKRRALANAVASASSVAALSVDDYRSRSASHRDERRAHGLLARARAACAELDARLGVKHNYLWLDPEEEARARRAAYLDARRFGPKTRLGDFGAEEGDEENLIGDDQARPALASADAELGEEDGEDEVFEDPEIEEREERKLAFLKMDARERLAETVRYLRERHSYCLWCGTAYGDQEELLAVCPGPSEDDH